jgi:hypothetical protein
MPENTAGKRMPNTDIRLARTLRTLDPSVHDEGECVPFNVTIRITETDIIVDVEDAPGDDLMKRSVWIEQQGSYLVVHCYDAHHEEPINVRIGPDRTSIDTDREGGLPK